MNFFSKCSTLTIVKKQGTTIVHLNGIPQTIPGEYIRFEDGRFSTENEEDIKFLLNHDSFGRDYVADNDQFKYTRRSMEPEHSIEIIKYGHAEGNMNPKKDPAAAMQEQIMERAKDIAKAMFTEYLKEQQKQAPVAPTVENKPVSTPKKGRGRPKKVVASEVATPTPIAESDVVSSAS